jgi:hypothetical protein
MLFYGVAVLPLIETPAGFTAKLAAIDLVLQPLRRVRYVTVQTRLEHLGDVQADVQPDLVGKLDRSHRHAELFRCSVDGFLFYPLVEHHHGFEQIGREGTIDEKARRTLHRGWQAIDAADKGPCP